MVTMLTTRALDLDPACVNVHGGACAQGHPVGSTGSRIIVTLIHALEHYGKKRGVAALCIGGGEATAMAIELDLTWMTDHPMLSDIPTLLDDISAGRMVILMDDEDRENEGD